MESRRPQGSMFEGSTAEPLAARMRPRTLDEFVGQDRIIGPGRLLRRAIQADQLSSVIFYGPPGTGKTTLARVIANTTKADFIALNAVLAGVKDIRAAVASGQEQRRVGRRTILFVDEVHRFNKAQQDALLPWVENGTVILIGATTENPYFEVNKALVSRSRIFALEPLNEDDLRAVAGRALADSERGYGALDVAMDAAALDHLVNVANGDARALLNALELAVDTTEPNTSGEIVITRAVAEESIQRRAVLYDKEGDAHFDTISAFIKSVRGSDADAALYWLAKMVYAGEDPRYIFRRLLVLASEDVGLADPNALGVTAAAAQAFDYVGLPEGRFHLAQATLYLATAPKSNSTLGFFDALAAVEKEREAEVPDHLKDANRDAEGLGHGQGYAYPHAYRDHWVAQQYLPAALQGKLFYKPSEIGFEAHIGAAVARRREAQLAAMLDLEVGLTRGRPFTALHRPLQERAVDRWLERTASRAGGRLAKVRDHLFELAGPAPHATILDLDAGSGLLTWEAIRRASSGQTWSVAGDTRTAESLERQAAELPELQRPVIVTAPLTQLVSTVAARFADQDGHRPATAAASGATGEAGPRGRADIKFDAIIGRGIVSGVTDLEQLFAQLRVLLAEDGRVVLAELDPTATQRLYDLVDLRGERGLEEMRERLVAAEERAYFETHATSGEQLAAAARSEGLQAVRLTRERFGSRETLSAQTVGQWFEPGVGRLSYADHMRKVLSEKEVDRLRSVFFTQLAGKDADWTTTYYFVSAGAP